MNKQDIIINIKRSIHIQDKTKTRDEFKKAFSNLSEKTFERYWDIYFELKQKFINNSFKKIIDKKYSPNIISEQATQIDKLINRLYDIKFLQINGFAKEFVKEISTNINKKVFENRLKTNSIQEIILSDYMNFEYGGKPINDWYEEYINEYNKIHPPKIKKNVYKYEKIEKPFLKYPFKSKISKYEINNMVVVDTEAMIPDFKLKSLKPLYRPTYSPEPYCWEIDILFINHPYKDIILQQYLVCINVNTRFLNVFPIKNKSKAEILKALTLLIKNNTVKSIKGDGEKSFASNDLKTFYTKNNIKTYFQKSPYTMHNKMVDSVIRTIRNGFGLDNYNIANIDLMKQMVKYYNNTYHNSIKMTPKEMNNNIDLEWQYIRKMDSLLKQVLTLQKKKGLHSYRKCNIIMIHIDYSKTNKKFEKQRRNFNELAEFIEYKNGNVVCKSLKSKEIIEIPIMYTKYVSDDIDSIPKTYKEYFVLRNI